MKERCPHTSFLYSKDRKYLSLSPSSLSLIMYVSIDRVQLVKQGQPLKTYKVNFSTEGISIAAKGIALIIGMLH